MEPKVRDLYYELINRCYKQMKFALKGLEKLGALQEYKTLYGTFKGYKSEWGFFWIGEHADFPDEKVVLYDNISKADNFYNYPLDESMFRMAYAADDMLLNYKIKKNDINK